jgi:predicted metal-dependent phosphoesterase TrpH
MIAAACHIHSTWSYDGKWTIPALAAEFSRRGYQVLMTTEHDRGFTEARRQEHRAACAAASNDKILVLPGIEYSDAANRVHVLVWGPVPFVGEEVPTFELLKAVKGANGVAVLAHPSRKEMWRIFEPKWADYLLGIEVWNRKTDGWAPSQKALTLVEQTKVVPFVGMDFHDRNQFFPLTMSLDIAGTVSEESVVDCLRHRRCHAQAWDKSLASVSEGWMNLALRSAEKFRRSGATLYRSMKRRRSSRHSD